ncbi:MAG TPA: hypothetical protein VL422_19365 [Miltoncostaea sp.]|nr:hypothetical protein [Miltoncostaea sp.]
MRVSRLFAAVLAGVAASALVPAAAQAALRADRLTIASTPATVRVVVHFSGSPSLTGLERQIDTPDPDPLDGRSSVRINATGITTRAAPVTKAGVTARVVGLPGRVVVRLRSDANRLKFVQYKVSVPRNVVVIDLWKVTSAAAARVLSDGCLKMTSWSAKGGRVKASGLELRPLFEHGLVLTARGSDGAAISEKPLTATEGVFLPDFSGYASPGHWSGSMPVPAASHGARVMLEAWSASAKDGSLECLVQTPVRLAP